MLLLRDRFWVLQFTFSGWSNRCFFDVTISGIMVTIGTLQGHVRHSVVSDYDALSYFRFSQSRTWHQFTSIGQVRANNCTTMCITHLATGFVRLFSLLLLWCDPRIFVVRHRAYTIELLSMDFWHHLFVSSSNGSACTHERRAHIPSFCRIETLLVHAIFPLMRDVTLHRKE